MSRFRRNSGVGFNLNDLIATITFYLPGVRPFSVESENGSNDDSDTDGYSDFTAKLHRRESEDQRG